MMNRRAFLRRTGALSAGCLGAGALGNARPAAAGEFTGKIRKAVKFHMVEEDLDVGGKFELLKEIGFDGTEFRTTEIAEMPGAGKAACRRADVLRAIENTGVQVHGIVNSSDPDISAAVELSKSLGGTSVLVVARYDKEISLAENWKRDQERIRKAIPVAEKNEVRILVENVWASYLISAFDMESFLDEIDSPWVGSYFDVGNNVRWGVPEHWIELLGKRIVKLDIKEYDTKLQRDVGLAAGFKVPIGQGSIDWAAVRGELAAINFRGWATAEVEGGDRARLTQIATEMDAVLDLSQ